MMHTYLPTYLPTYIHTYILTYLPTYLRTYVLTYLLTYLLTIHTYYPYYTYYTYYTYTQRSTFAVESHSEKPIFFSVAFAFVLDVVCKAVRPNVRRRYGMHCFGTYFTHVQTCEKVRVQSAAQCTAAVHTLHMSKPVITFVFKVLRNALLRCILYTCRNLWKHSCPKCYAMDCFGAYFHMSKPVIRFGFKVLLNGLLRYIRDTCPNLW